MKFRCFGGKSPVTQWCYTVSANNIRGFKCILFLLWFRYTCLVCSYRPVFDTVDMLTVHRKGKRHLNGETFKGC